MNLQSRKKPDSAVFWTRQVTAVSDELDSSGIYHVKKEYIEAKNDTIADYYIKLYRWFSREARRYIDFPAEYEFPVWMSVDESSMLRPVEGTVTLAVEVPPEKYILCNFDAWGYCVNYWYVPVDDADKEAHEAELRRYGLASDDELFLTDKGNFYPLLKRKVQDSWKRVFTLPPADECAGLVAVCWELRKEWVRGVEYYEEG